MPPNPRIFGAQVATSGNQRQVGALLWRAVKDAIDDAMKRIRAFIPALVCSFDTAAGLLKFPGSQKKTKTEKNSGGTAKRQKN